MRGHVEEYLLDAGMMLGPQTNQMAFCGTEIALGLGLEKMQFWLSHSRVLAIANIHSADPGLRR